MSTRTDLLSPAPLGKLELTNRLVMAPMTRNRAGEGGVPTDLMATYYTQRATAGLIVTEGTQPVAEGQGYPGTPGIHTDAQAAGWRAVTDAVHAEGGRIFVQLMHAGRISHPSLQPDGAAPVAPSAVTPAGEVFTPSGMQPFTAPRALDTDEIPGVIAGFVDAAKRAVDEAGFDGVEIHGANGYLLQQFLADNTNLRTDAYGGSLENRVRLVVEVVSAVADAIGPERVGLRVSPAGVFNDIAEENPSAIYATLLEGLAPLDIAYISVIENPAPEVTDLIRQRFAGALIVNPAFAETDPRTAAETLLADGRADLVAIGRAFLANPDLVARFSRDELVLNDADEATMYGGTEKGYTDYPTLA